MTPNLIGNWLTGAAIRYAMCCKRGGRVAASLAAEMKSTQIIERVALLAHDPGRAAHALKRRIEGLPHRLGIKSLWPGSFLASIPDRYVSNASESIRRSGWSPFQHTAGFLHGNVANNSGDLARFYLFNLMFEQIIKERLQGELAELGVYRGNTAVLLADFGRAAGKNIYLFDTFQGFSDEDLRGVDAGKKAEFADTSLESVRALVGTERVNYVVGHFPESTGNMPRDIAFCLAHLDCDLYAPMKAGLEYFYPRLVPGGFLVIHDYSSLHWDGAERAVDDFLADKRERVVPIPDKAGTAVVRKF